MGETDAGLERRLGELIVAIQIGIGVSFQNDDLADGGDAQIDAAVAADAQGAINRFTDCADALVGAIGERLGEYIFYAPTLAISLVPFGFEGRKFRLIVRDFGKNDFTERKDAQPAIAEQAH